MKWKVLIPKRVEKRISKLPQKIINRLVVLLDNLEEKGPIRGDWPNFSQLDKNRYHCHLTFRYVVCWEKLTGKSLTLEVYYVGSREKAPY